MAIVSKKKNTVQCTFFKPYFEEEEEEESISFIPHIKKYSIHKSYSKHDRERWFGINFLYYDVIHRGISLYLLFSAVIIIIFICFCIVCTRKKQHSQEIHSLNILVLE